MPGIYRETCDQVTIRTPAGIQCHSRRQDKNIHAGEVRRKGMEEKEAFHQFYVDNVAQLHRTVERLQEIQTGTLGNVAEDVVQDCFLIACVKWEEIRIHKNPMGWLVVTAKYLIANQIRRKDNQTVSYQDGKVIDGMGELDPNLDIIDNRQLLRDILTDQVEIRLLLYYLRGYKSAEIAAMMQMKESTVRVKINRIKDKIRGNWNE